jgi:hypothetical protein
MSDAKLSLAVLQRVSEFLADLPEEHLEDLATGRARLTFIPEGATTPRTPSRSRAKASSTAEPSVDVSAHQAALAQMQSRDEGRAYLNRLRVKPDLVSLAKLLGLGASGTKAVLVDRIVERLIGARLNSAAIRQL